MSQRKITGKTKFWILIPFFAIIFWLLASKPLFNVPNATTLYDDQGHLLGASIAADGQWRFPPNDSVPEKFSKALILFEDQYFYSHPGVNILSILRALYQNVKSRRIVSGGSTLTMQVIRLSRKQKSRTIKEKVIEILLAIRLEIQFSKDEILGMYASYAPFGGNTVGLEAAAWRYYGCAPDQLSWAEAATLAVLPNQPSLIYPGKRDHLLLLKRNRLLSKLWSSGNIDSTTLHLAKLESLPDPPGPLPRITPHLLETMKHELGHGKRFMSSIQIGIQTQINAITERHHQKLKLDHINNLAALVVEIGSGKIIAYCGNSTTTATHQNQVDIVRSRRSPGSTLKPFLYAAALDEGLILPASLLPDVPTYYQGFTPKNFALEYDGAVAANEALARSLNIPFVNLLYQYSYPKFNRLLNEIGFESLDRHPDHYGLSVILGGAEVTLIELANSYVQLTQKALGHNILHPVSLLAKQTKKSTSFPISTEAAWHTIEALFEVNRPGEEGAWKAYNSSQQIAWKTGTSFGFKDAWAVGVNSKYLVAVWVGNADGEARPNIIGSKVAAPILFDIFNRMKTEKSFIRPTNRFRAIKVCRLSGFKANKFCQDIDHHWIMHRPDYPVCPHHQEIFLNQYGQRVLKPCANTDSIRSERWFVLPPVMAKYYRKKHPDHIPLPLWSEKCRPFASSKNLAWIYPGDNSDVYIPTELNGQSGRVIFEVANQMPQQKVFWHLDNEYLGHTQYDHKFAVWIPQGTHRLTVVDELGEQLHKQFKVLSE